MIVFVFLQERAFFSHRYASENRFVPPFFGFLRVIALKTPGRSTFSHSSRKLTRELVQQATTVICVATQLHTIATGNMTPSYCVRGGRVRPVYLYCVDISEFVTNKLRDRGSLSSVPIVANAQDFLCRVAAGLGLPVAEKYDKINR